MISYRYVNLITCKILIILKPVNQLHKCEGHSLSQSMLYTMNRIIAVCISAAIIKSIAFGRFTHEQSMYQWTYHQRDRTQGT